MDINNYSYTNNSNTHNTIELYENDDIFLEVFKIVSWENEVYYTVDFFSYDGQVEVYENFENIEKALKLYNHIKDNYSFSCPDNKELENYIKDLWEGEKCLK